MGSNAPEPVYRKAIAEAERKFRDAAQVTGLEWETEAIFALQHIEANDYLAKVASQNPHSVRQAVMKTAAIGLSLNPAYEWAYLVPRGSQVVLDISYKGLIKLATESGAIRWAKAELVYEADRFAYKGPAAPPVHECDPFASDRGGFRGAYCIAKTAAGDTLVEVMSADEIYKVRDASESYAKKAAGPWVDWFEPMAKKSVIKRASKTWPQTNPRLQEAIHHLNQEAGEGLVDLNPGDVTTEADPEPETVDCSRVEAGTRYNVGVLIARAEQAGGAWQAAIDYAEGRLDGEDLAYARQALMAASQEAHGEDPAPDAKEALDAAREAFEASNAPDSSGANQETAGVEG